jgi:hypothetical protein
LWGPFCTSISYVLCGFSLRSFHCRFIERAGKKKCLRQNLVPAISNINHAPGSENLAWCCVRFSRVCKCLGKSGENRYGRGFAVIYAAMLLTTARLRMGWNERSWCRPRHSANLTRRSKSLLAPTRPNKSYCAKPTRFSKSWKRGSFRSGSYIGSTFRSVRTLGWCEAAHSSQVIAWSLFPTPM